MKAISKSQFVEGGANGDLRGGIAASDAAHVHAAVLGAEFIHLSLLPIKCPLNQPVETSEVFQCAIFAQSLLGLVERSCNRKNGHVLNWNTSA